MGNNAAKAGNALDAGVTAALAQFSQDFAVAADRFSKDARVSGVATLEAAKLLTATLEELNRSLGGAKAQFERFGELQIDRVKRATDEAQRRLEKLATDAVTTKPISLELEEVPDDPSPNQTVQPETETVSRKGESSQHSDSDGREL